MPPYAPAGTTWHGVTSLTPMKFKCAYCESEVASNVGYNIIAAQNYHPRLYVCPFCAGPNIIHFQHARGWLTAAPIGNPVPKLPEDVEAIYEEARRTTQVGCYTATVLLLRKLLMHIAVAENAEENLSFKQYIQYLADNHFISPKNRHWVDLIREKGNEANHEIKISSREDAQELLDFSEMLLRFIYQYASPAAPVKTAS